MVFFKVQLLENVWTLKNRWIAAATTAIAILGASGYLYRCAEVRLAAYSSKKILPVIPLSQFPYVIGDWQGADVPISETVLKVAANDDYLSRSYVDSVRHLQATLYVAYTSEPRRMLGHHPLSCYVGNGWVHDGTQEQILDFGKGRKIPCLVHRFHKGGLDYQDIVVLNYYIINGDVTSDHRQFSGLRWRRPRVSQGRVDYVAQVQISSVSPAALENIAPELTDRILHHFPESP